MQLPLLTPPATKNKQPGKKRAIRPTTSGPAKRARKNADHPGPRYPQPSYPQVLNTDIFQVLQTLAESVKSLGARKDDVETPIKTPGWAQAPNPLSSVVTAPINFLHTPARNNLSRLPPLTQSTHQPRVQPPCLLPSWQSSSLAPKSFSLSTALPVQHPGRSFITSAAATVYHLTKNNVLHGKDVNLAGLLLPSPAIKRQWVDCGDVSVLLKTTDPRLTCNLSFGEFVITFGIYRDIMC